MTAECTAAIGSLTGHSICAKVLCVCFLNLCFIFSCFHTVLKTKHATFTFFFSEDYKGGLYRDNAEKPGAQSADSENSSPSRHLT